MKPLTEMEKKDKTIMQIRKLRIEAELRLRSRIRKAKQKNDHFWIQYNRQIEERQKLELELISRQYWQQVANGLEKIGRLRREEKDRLRRRSVDPMVESPQAQRWSNNKTEGE